MSLALAIRHPVVHCSIVRALYAKSSQKDAPLIDGCPAISAGLFNHFAPLAAAMMLQQLSARLTRLLRP
jgi:hypothetical protein